MTREDALMYLGRNFIIIEYSLKAVNDFLTRNDYLSIIRGHEAQLEGFKMHQWDDQCDFPSVITIFSAPNYCDVYNNKGAMIKFDNNMVNIQQFNYTPHPFMLPDMQNLFHWSLPFVSEKSNNFSIKIVSEMLLHIIKKDKEVNPKSESSSSFMSKTDQSN